MLPACSLATYPQGNPDRREELDESQALAIFATLTTPRQAWRPACDPGSCLPLRSSQLSPPPRQELVRMCQTVNYGQIKFLLVRDGEPIYDPAPVVVMDAKLYRDDGTRPELASPGRFRAPR